MKENELNAKSQVEIIQPHPTEAIVLRFNFGDIDAEEGRRLFDYVKTKFPENTVITIPEYTSLRSCSKDALENIISMISEIIESL